MRVGLVGCVKTKLQQAAPAKDLYVSPLFRGRRAFVEASCDRWLILSARHGLVDPDETLEPYEETLIGKPAEDKRSWATQVLAQLGAAGVDYAGTVFEIHAGADYRNFGLVDSLLDRGAKVEVPTEHLGVGEQLGFYAGSDHVPTKTQEKSVMPAVSNPRGGRRSSYAPLGEHLARSPMSTVQLSFAQVERILGRALPASARNHLAWWSNDTSGTHSHARSWMDAGWVVESANLTAGTVSFRRERR